MFNLQFCKKCKRIKNRDKFYKQNKSVCRLCLIERSKEYQRLNPESNKKANRKRIEKNPEAWRKMCREKMRLLYGHKPRK